MRGQIAGVAIAGTILLASAYRSALSDQDRRAAWLDPRARADAEGSVKLFAVLSAHLHASGGDPRFAERIPADDEVVAELRAGAELGKALEGSESPRLVKLDVQRVEPTGPGVAEVRTREYWVTTSGGGDAAATRSDVVDVRYAVRRDAGRWRVRDWTIDPGDADAPVPEPRR